MPVSERLNSNEPLFSMLSANLSKNQREVRVQSLKALQERFTLLSCKNSTDPSDIIDLMVSFEE